MQLSKNFTLAELTKSEAAKRKGIAEQFSPPAEIIAALKALCENVLQPLRDKIGQPIRVNSGYRSPKVNTAIGGAKFSQHLKGQAADIEGTGLDNLQLALKIIELKIPFDQLILEFPDEKGIPEWLHISYNHKGKQRGQILVAISENGRTKYKPYGDN